MRGFREGNRRAGKNLRGTYRKRCVETTAVVVVHAKASASRKKQSSSPRTSSRCPAKGGTHPQMLPISSSLRKQGPIATGGYNCKGSCHNRCLKSRRHGVWVPAFAGTTSGVINRTRFRGDDAVSVTTRSPPPLSKNA